ncbi:hypothetical protein PF007_g29287 [Phytophthora fragariae]|uniref:RxLR effector protein n=1 Tax=Phytophthora fragariae TaxID=53985 RepID=A0A6A3PXU0_9STRA|nr:hypothetical protein PF007_g29287 [Phytophthora fragariae]
MQFGFFVLVAAAVLLVSSDIVLGSIDMDTTLSETSSPRPMLSAVDQIDSITSEEVALQKIARSKSSKLLNAKLNLKQVADKLMKGDKANLISRFKAMDKQNKNPDDMFMFFTLDQWFAGITKADKHTLVQAAKRNGDVCEQNILWYKYSKFYKKEHPDWVSNLLPLVKAK